MAVNKEIKGFGFIAFDFEQIDEIVNYIGFKFNRNGYLVDGKNTVKCSCCKRAIKKRNLGNVLPGSNIICCDNPVCFVDYMDTNLGL